MNFRVFALVAGCRYHARMARYEWKKLAGDSYQLIDIVSHRPVASIEPADDGWHWLRNTTVKHQGAPQAEGIAKSVEAAQAAILNGLPND